VQGAGQRARAARAPARRAPARRAPTRWAVACGPRPASGGAGTEHGADAGPPR